MKIEMIWRLLFAAPLCAVVGVAWAYLLSELGLGEVAQLTPAAVGVAVSSGLSLLLIKHRG